ncbi:ATP-binding protein [Agrobacterium rhizogenes]|nr:ATP-binding protein [Rhizobium rhizogenes]NTG25739.1 ATP-binding protein [Rhizobium rhizogenes]NTH62427.1 ATP-binding protein [Rhizobium rhizogenes]
MRIRAESPHISLPTFETAELPDFVLITGKNGSGKSHLLQAIANGAFKVTLEAHPSSVAMGDIRSYEFSFMPAGVMATELTQFTGDVQGTVKVEMKRFLEQFWNMPPGLPASAISAISACTPLRPLLLFCLTATPEEIRSTVSELVGSDPKHPEHAHWLISFKESAPLHFEQQSTLECRMMFRYLSAQLSKPCALISAEEIDAAVIPAWGISDLFSQEFSRLFVAYRNILLENCIAQWRSEKTGSPSVGKVLSDDQFFGKFGPRPWDVVNGILEDAGLDFEINGPDENSYALFDARLTKKSSGYHVRIADLSSGEKVLISIAFSLYHVADPKQLFSYPRLLLLDEVDAYLHPSMTKAWIALIVNTLVKKLGMKVIATTHSPSTVALAPDSSLFLMNSGERTLTKVTKADALNLLTEGVPTIALAYDGRRQVFVESPTDAKIYGRLYDLIRPRLSSERSLEFLATGTRAENGTEKGNGSANVKRIVTALKNAGNSSAFGLLDWDGENSPSDRISVLGYQRRDGIENVLLDPLLIAALICRDFKTQRGQIGAGHLNWVELRSSESDVLQTLVSRITELVFGSPPSTSIEVTYLCGLKLSVDERYLKHDDHGLEQKLLKAFPFLQQIARTGTGENAGRLMVYIIEYVLEEHMDFLPVEFHDVLAELLDAPAHLS